jgi:hypothetical protein
MSIPTPPPAAPGAVRLPLVWLLVILGLGLALRWLKLDDPLQLDEFGPLYAVARRVPGPDAKPLEAGTLPSKDDPLVPVGGWGEVSRRSVLPFGIADPYPLYHWLLYADVQALPIAEWSLRLPSLLAGLGCIAAIYYLVKRLLGAEAGLAAALLTAVDPFQVEASAMARPYALANLACVLSFLALLGILYSRRLAGRLGWAVLYGVALAVQGYFNPVLLLCVAAHVGLLAYWLLLRRPPEGAAAEAEAANAAPWAFREAPPRPGLAPLWWLAGCGLAAALLLPKGPYLAEVRQFGHDHAAYLSTIFPPHLLLFVLYQDGAFLVALLAAAVAGYAASQLARGKPSAAAAPAAGAAAPPPPDAASTGVQAEPAGAPPTGTTTQPTAPAAAVGEPPAGPPAPWNPDLLWLGLCWLLLPQLAAEFVALGAGQPVLFTKYLSYTSLGGVVLLAYLATRVRSRDLRLVAVGVTAAVLAAIGLTDLGKGYFLTTPTPEKDTAEKLDKLEEKGSWRPDDLILYRSAFIEADLLPSVTDPAAKAQLEGVIAAPLSTLYVGRSRRPFVALSLANSRGPAVQTDVGCAFDPATFYTPALADRIGRHTRYWVCTPPPRRLTYLSSLVPWLADATGWDLRVSRRPNLPADDPERHFVVPTGIGPDAFAAGLDDAAPDDFSSIVLVQRWAPPGGFAPALRVSAAPNAHFTVPLWLGTQCPTPRLTARPEAASDGGGGEGP